MALLYCRLPILSNRLRKAFVAGVAGCDRDEIAQNLANSKGEEGWKDKPQRSPLKARTAGILWVLVRDSTGCDAVDVVTTQYA